MKSLNEATRDAQAKAEELAESARQTAEAARVRIQDSYGRAREVGGELASKGREQAESLARVSADALEKGKKQATRANSKLKEAAKEQPMALVAGAVALGALLGSLLPKRRD